MSPRCVISKTERLSRKKRPADSATDAASPAVCSSATATQTFVVGMRVPVEYSEAVHSTVWVDQYSGVALKKQNFATDSPGYRMVRLNRALHTVILHRRLHDPLTKDYIARRVAEGKTRRDATRLLKRYLARHLYRVLEQQTPLVT